MKNIISAVLKIHIILRLTLVAAVILFALQPAYEAYAEATSESAGVETLKERLASLSESDIKQMADRFPDVGKHWAIIYIGKLAAIEVIDGMPDGTFKPDQPMQVDEFIKMTVCAMGFKPDRVPGYWAQPYIDIAMQKDIISPGEFTDYMKNITRQEAARIILKAILLMEDAPDPKMGPLARSKIPDYSSIDDTDKQSVLASYELGVMTGMPDGSFQPLSQLTRAEASTIIIRYLDINERDPFEPAASEVCVITEPDGNSYTVYPPSKLEVVEAANALKNGMPESKGFVRSIYASDSDLILFSFYESKAEYEANSISGNHMSIEICMMDNNDLLKVPYSITVYNSYAVQSLHRETIYSLLKYLYSNQADEAMAAFDRYLDYSINGDTLNRMETIEYSNRSGWFYKVANSDTFSMHINSMQ